MMKKGFYLLSILVFLSCATLLVRMFVPCPYRYNTEAATAYITRNASPRSKGLCAQHVRKALETGGCPTWGHPMTAKSYKSFLLYLDFTCIDKKGYHPKRGDIVVFSSAKGHPYGHIAMWNGKQWISDFRQMGLFVTPIYAKEGNFDYYRMTKKHPKRHYTLQHHITGIASEPLTAAYHSIKKYL